jgi:DNA-binding CsgD family transcriptional regulator
VAAGLTNGQVARRLDRSPHTINYHLRQIFRKANVRSRTELASLYYRSVVRDGNAGWAEAPSA